MLPAWYEKWTCLHYDEAEDHVLCVICENPNNHGMLNNVKVEDPFIKTGYSNWENAISTDKEFQKHESSKTSGNLENYTTCFHNAEKHIGKKAVSKQGIFVKNMVVSLQLRWASITI